MYNSINLDLVNSLQSELEDVRGLLRESLSLLRLVKTEDSSLQEKIQEFLDRVS